MKKLFGIIILLFLTLPSYAYVIDLTKEGQLENLVSTTGYKLLNANRIPYRITFSINQSKNANAASYYRSSSIVITKGMLQSVNDENEIAAVLAHEISHAIDYKQGVFKGYFSFLTTGF